MEKVLQDLKIKIEEKRLDRWKKLLNKALWYQDVFMFFSSRNHFDNCCITEGLARINQQIDDIELDYEKLQKTNSKKERNKLKDKIIFRAGRILHSTQDFFSHSNFVELMEQRFSKIEDIPTLDFWNKEGQERISELIAQDLYSEKFLLSFPHKCPENMLFKNFAKDDPKQKAGKTKTVWLDPQNNQNLTGFEAAMYFAEKSTYQILFQLFTKYTLLTSTQTAF